MQYIHKYTRDKRNELSGVVLATKRPDGTVAVGWSKCCKQDAFNKAAGIQIALGRALNGSSTPLPTGFRPEVDAMANRASRYFKS